MASSKSGGTNSSRSSRSGTSGQLTSTRSSRSSSRQSSANGSVTGSAINSERSYKPPSQQGAKAVNIGFGKFIYSLYFE